MTFADAGHLPQFSISPTTGKVQPIKTENMLLGFDENAEFRASTMDWEPGDLLVLFTDGVVEAKNPEEQEFGLERLETFLSSRSGQEPKELIQQLQAELESFQGEGFFEDDLTFVVVRLR